MSRLLSVSCLVFLLGGLSFDSDGRSDALQIKALKQLNFGTIKAGGISGSITVSASDPALVTTTGGVYAVAHGQHNATQVRMEGQANTLIFISLQNQAQMTSAQGKTLDLKLHLNSSLRHLGPSGDITDVFIGGTLTVDANQSAGQYSGDFTIMVDYQ